MKKKKMSKTRAKVISEYKQSINFWKLTDIKRAKILSKEAPNIQKKMLESNLINLFKIDDLTDGQIYSIEKGKIASSMDEEGSVDFGSQGSRYFPLRYSLTAMMLTSIADIVSRQYDVYKRTIEVTPQKLKANLEKCIVDLIDQSAPTQIKYSWLDKIKQYFWDLHKIEFLEKVVRKHDSGKLRVYLVHPTSKSYLLKYSSHEFANLHIIENVAIPENVIYSIEDSNLVTSDSTVIYLFYPLINSYMVKHLMDFYLDK